MSTEARVLIVENNDALRVMLFTILRHQPLGVDTAASGEEALEKVSNCDYALILIDMDLPDNEAGQFLRDFRAARPNATSFVLGVRDPSKEVIVDPSSVSAFISKPIELDTLADAVRECARVVPPPEDPLNCPPAESRQHIVDTGSQLAN